MTFCNDNWELNLSRLTPLQVAICLSEQSVICVFLVHIRETVRVAVSCIPACIINNINIITLKYVIFLCPLPIIFILI